MAGDFLVTRPDLFPAIIYNFYRPTKPGPPLRWQPRNVSSFISLAGKKKIFLPGGNLEN
jgi:hypothetical protein